MNNRSLRLKIEQNKIQQEELNKEYDALVSSLQVRCDHQTLVILQKCTDRIYCGALICTHCGTEWSRFPMHDEWYDLRYSRLCREVTTFDEWVSYRL